MEVSYLFHFETERKIPFSSLDPQATTMLWVRLLAADFLHPTVRAPLGQDSFAVGPKFVVSSDHVGGTRLVGSGISSKIGDDNLVAEVGMNFLSLQLMRKAVGAVVVSRIVNTLETGASQIDRHCQDEQSRDCYRASWHTSPTARVSNRPHFPGDKLARPPSLVKKVLSTTDLTRIVASVPPKEPRDNIGGTNRD